MTKQELIDHLEHLAEYVKYSEDAPALRETIAMLKCSEMPNGSDAINRQMAILLLRKDLKDLSSAQPEIIRCEDCKHRPTPTRADEGITYGFSVEFPDEKCPCQCEDGWYNWYPENDFYCGYAERREE